MEDPAYFCKKEKKGVEDPRSRLSLQRGGLGMQLLGILEEEQQLCVVHLQHHSRDLARHVRRHPGREQNVERTSFDSALRETKKEHM